MSAGCGGGNIGMSSGKNDSTVASKGSTSGGLITKSAGFDQYVRQTQEGVQPKPDLPNLSPEEAQKQDGIKTKLPTITFDGKLEGVYAATSASGQPATTIIYSSGFSIDEQVLKEKPDYGAQIATDAQSKKEASVYIGGDYHPVMIAGFEGKAASGYSFVGLDKKEYKMPPQLYWWENGVQYIVTCWKLGFTEQQLIELAESMYK